MDWDKLKTFHAAGEAGSLTKASEALGLSQSAASRQIAGLEDELGAKLFHRHARGLQLTEQGRLLFEASKVIAAKVAFAEAQVHDSRDEPTGRLRVTAPTALGTTWLAPRLKRFQAAYPRIQLLLLLTDQELDIASMEADIAIRPWAATQNDVIQRKLMDVRQHIYASHDYLEDKSEPASPKDLDEHALLAYGPRHLAPIPNLNWILKLGLEDKAPPREPVMEVNTIKGVMKLAEAGIGLAGLPDYVARENNNLVRVLPDIEGPAFETFLLFPEELKGSRRVTAFRDFLLEEARAWEK